jgi:hypothetical protein
LQWRHRRHQIGLYRWAPAGTILARTSLAGFAAAQFRIPEKELTPLRKGRFDGIEGGWFPGVLLPARFGHYRARRMLRLWFVKSHNCLLGVEVHGRGRGLSALFERLCDSYGCL